MYGYLPLGGHTIPDVSDYGRFKSRLGEVLFRFVHELRELGYWNATPFHQQLVWNRRQRKEKSLPHIRRPTLRPGMGRQSGCKRILSILPHIVRFLIRFCEFEPSAAMAPNDLLDDPGGFRNGLWGALKFEEKGVLDRIRSLNYTGCVDGRHHYGSYTSTERLF